uniref:Uncharacterized protein n=1 Tax=Globisporangium ultimum (strain ATCC 200006 / CBS 805.95 / DAOM BR144) TaxID=431595 RepID=K3WUC0_GLOUD
MRRESEARLRIKKLQLKRFHDQICLRITERENQNRVRAQQREKLLDDKFTKVIEATKPRLPQRSQSAMSLQIEKVLQEETYRD